MNDLSIYKRIISYVKTVPYFIGSVIAIILFAMTKIVQSISIKFLIEAAQARDSDKLIAASWYLAGAILVIIVILPFFRFMWTGCSVIAKGKIKKDALKRIIQLPLKYFENTHSGIIMTNITSDMEITAELTTWRLYNACSPFISAFFAIVPMLILNFKVSLVLISVNLLLSAINLLFTIPMKKISGEVQKSLDVFNEKLFNMLSGFEIMKLFHIESKIGSQYANACDTHAKQSLRGVALASFLSGLNEFIARVCSIGMIMVGIWLVDMKIAAIGTILTLIDLQGSVNRSFLYAGEGLPKLQQTFVSGRRVFKIMDEAPEPVSYPSPSKNMKGAALHMENVSFSYANGGEVAKNINLTVKHGQTVALAGPSGGGKSTLFKLFLGFYPPDEGNIIINEKSQGQYTLTQIRDLISYVPQDAYLFYGTIEENIRYGKTGATQDEVINAAKAAYIHDFIIEQPEGYQTIIRENGASLSGGQRQRIAIARAFLKNAPILLLDEATASLDLESEKNVFEAMDNLMKNRTILLIAHRLSTIENADIIYVVSDGQIKEQGNHSDLLAQNSLYKDLYLAQLMTEKTPL